MELWTITNDLVPWNHEYYVKFRLKRTYATTREETLSNA